MLTVTLGACTLEVDEAGVTTVFPDGRRLRAEPESGDEYRRTAAERGYGDDTLALCREHEAIHSLLAAALGLPWSPTLRSVVCDDGSVPGTLQWAEEAAVLSIQTFVNRLRAAGVDVPALAGLSRVDT